MEAIGKFPIYEADQVLSANHLNQSLGYLETHDRLSRRLLHGVGIVCGFDFTFSEGVLTIQKGVGISSEGYLLFSEEEMVLTQIRNYIPLYPPKYETFYTNANQPYQLWEAVPASQAEGENLQPLADFNVSDKVLLLYLEAKDKDLKECVGDDCDNNGTVREYTLRPLLIKVTDLVKIFNKDGNTVEDIASSVFARYTLTEVVPPRFDVTPQNVKTVVDINQSYAALCDDLLPEVKGAMQKIELLYADALGIDKQMASILQNIEKELAAIKKEELGLQYYFDHLCDIAAAYNEFAEIATRWVVSCIPDADDFPMHLALGEFVQFGNYPQKVFRNYFKHAATAPSAHEQRKHVHFLYMRLLKIAQNFELQTQRDTKITPSNFAMALSKKAVPYYYVPSNQADNSWLIKWDFYRTQRNTWQRVGHFHNQPENLLRSEIEFNNFYRVEGYLGRNYTSALASIQSDIQNYRVPIKTIALSTGSVPFDLNLLEDCHVEDIEENFNDAKNSLYCQMQEVSCFFGSIGIPVARDNTKAIAGAATHATGAATHAVNTPPGLSAARSAKSSYTRLALVTNARTTNFAKGQFMAARCQVKANTLGRAYLDAVAEGTVANISLLDVYLPYINLNNVSSQVKMLYLVYLFPYIVIDEIEELAGILHESDLNSLDFNALKVFANEFTAFVDLYIEEINEIDADPDVDLHPLLHDIKHHLLHLRSFCNLKALFSIYTSYRHRVVDALEKFRFSNFIQEHPGIDHKAGAPRGGTFILVYHTEEKKERPDLGLTNLKARTDVRASADLYKRVVDNNPAVLMTASAYKKSPETVSITEANQWMERNLAQYGAMTNQYISAEMLANLRAFLNLRAEETAPNPTIPEGTVVADFYLPYMACSGCGGIEITLKEEKEPLSLSLEKARFCQGDTEKYKFTASPVGGEITGAGVAKSGDDFFFEPAEVKTGSTTFTYTFDGRTVQLTVSVIPAPEAAFIAEIDSTPNGSFVRFKNNSTNATQYLWDFGNGQTSNAENPEVQAYKVGEKTAVVVLKASNGICNDEDVQTITLATDNYQLVLTERGGDICSDQGEMPVIIEKNGTKEKPPYDGVVTGKGVAKKGDEYLFNPSKANIGENKLEYTVEGEIVATLTVKVVQTFAVDFQVDANWTEFGVSASITEILPAGKKAYNWVFDQTKPTQIEIRKNNNKFAHIYSAEDVKGKETITIELTVPDGPCSPKKAVTFTVPKQRSQPATPTTFVVTDISTRLGTVVKKPSINTGVIGSSMVLSGRTANTNPATKLLNDLNTAINNAAARKKLVAGEQNAALAKAFTEVLGQIETAYSKNKAKITAAQKKSLMEGYGAVAETMIDVIGMLTSDLSPRETLMKSFQQFGQQAKALKSILGTSVVNGIKNRLAALTALNKPNASAEASKINATL